ncbi:MAG: hypothetical protein ACI4EN_04960 [Butyrivibrio sp.]
MKFYTENITKIEVRNGNTGDLVIVEADKAETILKLLSEMEFSKGKKTDAAGGWSYLIKAYNCEELIYKVYILTDNKIIYDGYFYSTKEKFELDKLEQLYE